MNKYESVIIINHNIDDKTIEEIISKTTDLITKQGKVTQINKIGIKKLAYEIRKSDDDLKSEDMYYQRYGYNGLHRPLTAQCFNERQYYNYVQAFDVNIKNSTAQFGLRVRTKAISQLNKGVRVWKVLPDASYYETN